MTFRVLATARSFCMSNGPHHDYLRKYRCVVEHHTQEHPLLAEELRKIIGGYDGAILGLDVCDASVIDSTQSLKVISRYGVGVDQIDLNAASRRGIVVTNTPGASKIGVAELSVALMFALARNIPQVATAARRGEWQRGAGWELFGKTLGIIGLGVIGREVAMRASALGMQVLASDPIRVNDLEGIQSIALLELIERSDVISLHCALSTDTRHLIDRERLAQMRKGAYLVNTARGDLIDEVALYEALKSGHLGGAASDVFHNDPPTNNPLLTLENFIATPHIGATTLESVQRVSMMAAQNLMAVLLNEPCPYIVNAPALEVRK